MRSAQDTLIRRSTTGIGKPTREKKLIQMLPRRRVGHPRDLDALLVTLCSDQSHFINGAVIAADDGFCLVCSDLARCEADGTVESNNFAIEHIIFKDMQGQLGIVCRSPQTRGKGTPAASASCTSLGMPNSIGCQRCRVQWSCCECRCGPDRAQWQRHADDTAFGCAVGGLANLVHRMRQWRPWRSSLPRSPVASGSFCTWPRLPGESC